MAVNGLQPLAVGFGLLSGAYAWVWALVWLKVGEERASLTHWMLASLLGGTGFALMAMRTLVPSFWSYIGANLCLLGFAAVFMRGAGLFLQRPLNDRELLTWAALCGLGLLWVGIEPDRQSQRIVVTNLGALWLLGRFLPPVWTRTRDEFGGLMTACALAPVLLFIALCVLRVIFAVEAAPAPITAPHHQLDLRLSLIVIGLFVTVLNLMYLLQLVLRMRNRLVALALTDALTGLLNRRGLQSELEAVWTEHEQDRRPFAVLCLDVDHFKRLNDDHGHAAGDDALRDVARVMRLIGSPYDICARTGGEEFVLLMPGCGLEDAERVGERLRAEFSDAPTRWGTAVPNFTVSVGAAMVEAGDDSTEAVLHRADRALYRAKREGRNRLVAFRGDADEGSSARRGWRAPRLYESA